MLALELLQPMHLLGAYQPRFSGFGESQKVGGMALAHLLELAALGKLLQCILAHRFQHVAAGLGVAWWCLPQQALVQQGGEAIDATLRDLRGRLRRAAANEHGHSAQQLLVGC